MSKEGESTGFLSFILAIIRLITDFLYRSDEKKKQKEIAMAQDELRKALAEGRITDAAFWRRRLDELRAAAAILIAAAMLAIQGCATQPQPMPVVIGERINKVKPGETIKVPPLLSPAKQWYLVDDAGLSGWLGIKP